MNEEQFQQLLEQARRGEAPAVREAVDLEPGLVTRAGEVSGHTILHNACQGGHVDLARDFLDRKADLHQRDGGGRDALMFATAAAISLSWSFFFLSERTLCLK